jgi:Bacterial cadherin-like domain/Bacterial Ig domain/IPTL-CTERM motif
MTSSPPARTWLAVGFALLGSLAADRASAVTEFRTLLDLDNDPTTGCVVPTADGPFAGVEQVLITTVSTANPPEVTSLTRQICAGAVFGPPSSISAPFPPPWPVGLGVGVNGSAVIETYLPLSLAPHGNEIRLGFASEITSGGSGQDALLTTTGAQGAPPIIIVLASIIEVPTLGEWGLLLLSLGLAAAGWRTLRRSQLGPGGPLGPTAAGIGIALLLLGAGVAWAAIVPDGNPADWGAAAPNATDPATEPVNADIVAVFARVESNILFLRIDARILPDSSPSAVDDAATVPEDAPATTINVLANDSDPDGDAFSIASATQPANGTVVVAPGGASLTYQPNPNYCNTPPGTTLDTFNYTLTPGGSTAVVSVTVTCADDAPTAVADVAMVQEDAAATPINVLANDTDPDAGPKSIISVTQPANGTVVITGGGTGLTYQPNPGYCNNPPGTILDVFNYTLTPGGSSTTVDVTVNCVDDGAVATDDAATVAEDAPATTVNVLVNDNDPDGDPFTIASVTQPANGAVVITNAGADLTYQPNPDYCNTPPGTTLDTFTYTLTPGGDTATVSMTVTCVNDDPVAVDDAATVAEEAPATAVDVLANDTDADVGDVFTVASVTQPANGTVVITGGGTGLTYQPNSNYCNTQVGGVADTFTYTLTPGGDTATVSMTVTCSDDTPVAVADSATVSEDAPATAVDVLTNDTDVDGGPKSIASVTQPANGAVVITGGGTGLTYQPNPNYCNTQVGGVPDTFTYTLTPGSSSTTVSMTVTCVDDTPVAVADAATVAEDAPATAIDVLANDTDGDGGTISVASVTQPANGAVVITGGGTGLTYQPNPNYCNTPPGTTLDTFTYTLTPGSSSTTVSVTVTCVDDDPVAVADAATVTEDAAATPVAVLANDTDPDGGAISIGSVTQPANGVVVITGGGTGLTYQPNANYCNSQVGGVPDTFTYTLTPGGSSTTVSMTVTCVDDNPVAVADAATVLEDAAATAVDVLANDTDVDAGPKSVASVTQPANGAVVITGGGTGLTYQPNPNYCNSQVGGVPDTFTYTLTPGGSSTTVSVTVTCVDDNPVAVADGATVAEDSGATAVDVLANDTDVDAGPKSVASVTQPANGTVVNNGTNVTYQPNPNYCNTPPGTTPDTFTYTLAPGGSSTTVSVAVTCVDDNPVAVADAATVTEDAPATAVDVLANDTDIDAGPKSVGSVTQPANGAVVITGGGTGLTYQPNPNYCNTQVGGVPDTFTYTLTPGGSSTTVSVTVTCVDDPPTAVADAASIIEDAPATAIDVLANDTDPDAGPKSVASVTQPANGTVIITGGGTGLTYQPAPNYCNLPPGTTPDTFTYTLAPGGSSTTVSVLVMCVNDPPVADNDAFDFVGNTELRVDTGAAATPHVLETTPTTFGVIDGDSDPVENDPIFVSAIVGCADITAPFNCVIAGVGTIDMESNGRFSFVPLPGDTGATEVFQYTLSDGQATVNATVTLTRFERVWYVKNDSVAGGLGRSNDPFDTLVEAQTASLVNDYIFVYFGSGAAGGQNQGIALKNGQHLIGEHAGLSLNINLNGNGAPTNLVAAVAGNRPLINDNGAGAPEGVQAIDAVPAEIVGLSLGGANVNAIDWTTNAAFAGGGSFSIRDNVIRTAAAEGVDITLSGTGAVNLAFHDNTLTSTGTALDIQKPGTGTLTITAFSNNVVNGNSAATGLVVNNALFDAVPGGGVNVVSGGTTSIGTGGNGVGGAGLILGNVTGSLSFTDLDIFTDNGAALQAVGGAGGFTLAVAPAVSTLQATNGPAVDVSSTAITLPIQNVQSTNSPSSGVSLATVTGTFSAGAGSTLTTNTGRAVQVDGSNVTFSYAGTITNNGTGISLTNNTGSTISFTGAMTMSTGANAAFTATGGGTVTSTNNTSTLTTTTGTALNVANTTIGATGLTFRSIAAGTAASGPVNGIVLNNTGASAGLTVAGTGAAGTGGTIQRTTGDSLLLTNTRSVSLSWMNVQNSLESGILGTSVTGLNLTNCTFTSNGDDSADVGIKVTNLAGNATFSNTSVTGSALANVFIDNTTGTLSSFNISGGSYSSLGTAFGGNSILLNIRGTSALTTGNISGITLSNNKPARAITIQAQDTATIADFTVQNSTFTNNGVQASFEQSGSANLTFKLLNNPTMTMTLPAAGTSHAINVASSSTSTGGTIQGRVQGNTIGSAATPSSGSPIGNGIRVFIQGRTQATLLIDGNVIRQVPQARGIDAQFLGPLSIQPLVQSDITVTNNDVNPQDSTGFPSAAIYLAADSQVGSPVRMRSDVRGNTVPAGAAVDSLPTFLIVDEVAAAAEAQLVDTAPASANCTAQLTSTNTGSSSAAAGCALIAGSISTPP